MRNLCWAFLFLAEVKHARPSVAMISCYFMLCSMEQTKAEAELPRRLVIARVSSPKTNTFSVGQDAAECEGCPEHTGPSAIYTK